MMKTCICDRLRGRDGKEKEPFKSTSVDSRHGRLDYILSGPAFTDWAFSSFKKRDAVRRAEFPGVTRTRGKSAHPQCREAYRAGDGKRRLGRCESFSVY